MLRNAAPYLAVFALALAFRAPHLARTFPQPSPPGRTESERAAVCLVHKGQLGDVFAEGSGASAHLSPLYPWLLAQVYRGADAVGGDPRRWQEAFVTLLTCTGIALLPLLARQAKLQPGAGWLAALLLSALPGNRHFETSGCHEQPLLFVVLTAKLIVFARLHDQRWRSPALVLGAAALAAVSALLGPMLLAACAVMALLDLWLLRGDRRAVLTGVAVLAMSCCLTLVPWAARNQRVLGGWVWTRSNFGLELWVGNNPGATGKTYSAGFAELHPFTSATEAREYVRLGELRYMREKGEDARGWIASHRARFCRLTAWRAGWFWFPDQSMVWWDGRKWVVYLYGASTVGLLAGLAGLFRAAHPHRWLFLGAAVGFSLPYLITHVDVRYRYPLVGVCALLSCDFAVRLARFLKRSWRPR